MYPLGAPGWLGLCLGLPRLQRGVCSSSPPTFLPPAPSSFQQGLKKSGCFFLSALQRLPSGPGNSFALGPCGLWLHLPAGSTLHSPPLLPLPPALPAPAGLHPGRPTGLPSAWNPVPHLLPGQVLLGHQVFSWRASRMPTPRASPASSAHDFVGRDFVFFTADVYPVLPKPVCVRKHLGCSSEQSRGAAWVAQLV